MLVLASSPSRWWRRGWWRMPSLSTAAAAATAAPRWSRLLVMTAFWRLSSLNLVISHSVSLLVSWKWKWSLVSIICCCCMKKSGNKLQGCVYTCLCMWERGGRDPDLLLLPLPVRPSLFHFPPRYPLHTLKINNNIMITQLHTNHTINLYYVNQNIITCILYFKGQIGQYGYKKVRRGTLHGKFSQYKI